MIPSSPPDTNPRPSLKNSIELMGPQCPLILPTSFPCKTLQTCASKPAFPAVIAAMIAETPPPITVWNLGLLSEAKRGEIETAFIGNSCLKYLNTQNVSGSIILEPLSAAVAKTAKFFEKAIELILTPSWMTPFPMISPLMAQWMRLPSVVATKKDWLPAYQRARVEVLVGCLSPGIMVAKSVSRGMRSTLSAYLETSKLKSVLKSYTFMREGVCGLYSS